MSAESDKSPLERLLDAGVYAPLGYLLTRKKTRQDLIKAGRKQIAFSRSLGQAALKGLSRRNDPPTPASTPVRPSPLTPEPVVEPDAEPTADDLAEEALAAGESAAAEHTSDVAIPDYDDLTAKDIVSRLGDADAEQVLWVQQQEMAAKERVTVLRAAERRLRSLAS